MEVMQGSKLADVFINKPGERVSCRMVALRVACRSAKCEELQKDMSDWVKN